MPGAAAPIDVTVVCPFYNERQIIREAVTRLLERLQTLEHSWELIVVNDGSTDGSADVIRELEPEYEQLRLVGYELNRGRGHALRTGIARARGRVIVTTEIDLSWGETIVHDLVAAMERWPDADMVVASPNLPGGGYRNVPRKRVLLSRFGNRIIRAFMSNAATMNTGMTRAYRADAIQSLPLHENGKEFHLEVMLKATTLGFRVYEIPATLAWHDYKHQGKKVKRKSSSKVNRLIVSHSLFSIFANPVRYVWLMSGLSVVLGVGWMAFALVLFLRQQVSAYTALMGVLLIVVAILLFVLGVVLHQGNTVQRELWLLEQKLQRDERRRAAPRP